MTLPLSITYVATITARALIIGTRPVASAPPTSMLTTYRAATIGRIAQRTAQTYFARLMRVIVCLLFMLPTASLCAQPTGEAVGSIDLPYLFGDGGMVAMQAGRLVTVEWLDAPPHAALYLFLWKPSDSRQIPFLMGIDTNPRDTVQIQWTVAEYLSGKPVGLAFYADGTWVRSTVTSLEYGSGEAPPAGICSVSSSGMNGSPEVFDNPPGAGSSYILGYVSSYPPVLDRITDPDGFQWLKIDLTAVPLSPIDPNRPIPDVGWVYAQGLQLHGDCQFLE